MNQNKTTILRFKPIEQITEEEMKEEVLCNSGTSWCQGFVKCFKGEFYTCFDPEGVALDEVELYAVLPKEE